MNSPEPDPYRAMREAAKNYAERDRKNKSKLVKHRRDAGLTQSDVDTALGMPEGWTRDIEAYDSDPRLSELRLYENYVMFVKGRGGKRML